MCLNYKLKVQEMQCPAIGRVIHDGRLKVDEKQRNKEESAGERVRVAHSTYTRTL